MPTEVSGIRHQVLVLLWLQDHTMKEVMVVILLSNAVISTIIPPSPTPFVVIVLEGGLDLESSLVLVEELLSLVESGRDGWGGVDSVADLVVIPSIQAPEPSVAVPMADGEVRTSSGMMDVAVSGVVAHLLSTTLRLGLNGSSPEWLHILVDIGGGDLGDPTIDGLLLG
ncbi:hypothetical protein HOY80DRAFT_1048994 [Tuber brumale]|nr:hypothetical protein HOY80DRAFT_1048994 [Tuber brumale]